jgi:flagellar biosynthetic protein FliR
MTISITSIHLFTAFWLMFSKWAAALVQLPHFDEASVPMKVKVLFALFISIAFSKILMPTVLADLAFVGHDNFFVLLMFYTITGLILGYFVKSIMFVFQTAGSLITQQIGFSMVSYFDPSAGQQIGPFEKLIKWTLLVMIISTAVLNPMLKGLIDSFHFLSFRNFVQTEIDYTMAFDFIKGLILSALILASPLIFMNVLVSCLLGVVARIVPQMNIIMVSFVINIGLVLVLFTIITNEFFATAFQMYVQKLGIWFKMIRI